MKVAFVLAHLSRASAGVATGVLPLVEELQRVGLLAGVYGVRDRCAPGDSLLWGRVAHASRELGPRAFGYAPDLLRAIMAETPDIVDAQGLWMYPSLASLRACERLGRPRIVSPHGMLDPWALRRSAWKKRLALWLFEGKHLRGAACIRALNRSELQAIRAFGLRNPVAVVPNGVDPPEALPDRCGRPTRTLLFFSRIDPKKGVLELLRGWALADVARHGWRLRVVGWGPPDYVETARTRARELGLDPSVELAGPAFGEDKARAFREADAFVLPSHSEGLPMAVLEAWSWALPVLMTRACNLPEGFERGAALEIGTEPERIAEGIRALVDMSDEERAALGRSGRRLVEERFTWPEVARQMIEVYRWVLGGGPPPACVVND